MALTDTILCYTTLIKRYTVPTSDNWKKVKEKRREFLKTFRLITALYLLLAAPLQGLSHDLTGIFLNIYKFLPMYNSDV